MIILTAHNHITLLHCGAEFFPALIAAIDAAKSDIYLETYIFADDETGVDVKAALMRAATRGVAVRVIADWLGTGRSQCRVLKRDLRSAGARCRIFNEWFIRGVARTHRKICVIDQHIAFLGGLNINSDMRADDDYNHLLPAPRWDFAVKIRGPLVQEIYLEAKLQWDKLGQLDFKSRWNAFKQPDVVHSQLQAGVALAGLAVRDNIRNRRVIQRTCLQALYSAKKSAMLANPYFAPGRTLRDALAAAAERGVEVTLLLGVGQFRWQDAVAHAYYPELLKCGVKIVEYRKTQLHGKVAVVDDDWATVGSSNYDGFSLFVNQEANIIVSDADFSNALRGHIERGVAEGVVVDPDDFSHTPFYKRMWYGAAYLIYKNLLRVLTMGRYQ